MKDFTQPDDSKLTTKDLHLFWRDHYSGGSIRGHTHATRESGIALCGLNLTGEIGKGHVDGGYQSVYEAHPSCSRCDYILTKLGI